MTSRPSRHRKLIDIGVHRVLMVRTLDGKPWYKNYQNYTVYEQVGGSKKDIGKRFIKKSWPVKLTADGYVFECNVSQEYLDREKADQRYQNNLMTRKERKAYRDKYFRS